MIVGEDEKPSLEELSHHGVLGMKWGHRKATDSGGETARQKNRRLNKETKAKQNAKRDASIEAARARYNESSRANYLKAKEQYKKDKVTIGSRAAKEKFNKVKQKNIDDFNLANEAKSGHETTVAILATVGTIAVAGILSGLAGSSSRY